MSWMGVAGLLLPHRQTFHRFNRPFAFESSPATVTSNKPVRLQVPLGTVVFARPEDDSAGPAAASHQWDVDPAAGFGSGSESEPEAAEGESLGEQLSRRLGDEVADLSQPGQRFLAAAGGEGGRGNAVAPSRCCCSRSP